MRDAVYISRAERQLFQEIPGSQHGAVGVIGWEHEPVNSYLEKQIEKIGSEIEAAESVIDVLAQVRADCSL